MTEDEYGKMLAEHYRDHVVNAELELTEADQDAIYQLLFGEPDVE